MKLKLKLDSKSVERVRKSIESTSTRLHSIWLIDDEAANLAILKDLLQNDYHVKTFRSSTELLTEYQDSKPDVIISDQRMPDTLGTELFSRLQEMGDESIRVIVTGYTDIKDLIRCINEGLIFRYIIKPWSPDTMKRVLADCFQELYRRRMNSLSQAVHEKQIRSLNVLLKGVAHEINTPLGISITTASSINDKTRNVQNALTNDSIKKSDLISYLKAMTDASSLLLASLEKSAGLVKSFRAVSAAQCEGTLRKFDLLEHIRDIVTTFQTQAAHKEVDIQVGDSPPMLVESYPGMWVEIIGELIGNALQHAFPKKQQGAKISITLAETPSSLRLDFCDNGVGVAEDIRARIFEPFFTTSRGQGSHGLGLHKVRNFVTYTLAGEIECKTPPEGTGTLLSINFERKSKITEAKPEVPTG